MGKISDEGPSRNRRQKLKSAVGVVCLIGCYLIFLIFLIFSLTQFGNLAAEQTFTLWDKLAWLVAALLTLVLLVYVPITYQRLSSIRIKGFISPAVTTSSQRTSPTLIFKEANRRNWIRFVLIFILIFILLATMTISLFLSLFEIYSGPQSIVASEIPNLKILTYFPTTMKIDQVYLIQIALVPMNIRSFDPQITPVETATTIVTNPSTVGTPNATIQRAFGPEYNPVATATLSSGASVFQIQHADTSPTERSLMSSSIVWEWLVRPKIVGKQVIVGSIEFRWKPLKQGKEEVYTIGYTNLTIQVEENEASLSPSSITSLPLLFWSIVIIAIVTIALFLGLGIFVLSRWFRREKPTLSLSPLKGETIPLPRDFRVDIERTFQISAIPESLILAVQQTGAVQIFYSYAHEDKILCDELRNHLAPLRRQGLIIEWYDEEITPGAYWRREIEAHFAVAHIILLLISPDFMKSDYCYSIEMKRALERHEAGESLAIPILLRPISWEDTPLAELQVLPTGGKPVSTWDNQDKALHEVSGGIRRVVEALQSRRTGIINN